MNPDHPSCPGSERTLLLLGGELSPTEAAAARRHLEACPSCQSLRSDLEAVEEAYRRSVPRLDAAEIACMIPRAATAVRGRPRGRTPLRTALAAAAAMALFAGGVFTGTRLPRQDAERPEPGLRMAGPDGTGLRSDIPVHRARAVAELARSQLTSAVAADLIGLLGTEPNPNVRLGIMDALRAAGAIDQSDRARILTLLGT